MNKKTDTLFYIIGIVLIAIFISCINGYCATVTDNAKGNKGYILINNGKGQGHQGTWTDIKTVPELKGDKGDKGEQGIQGLQGNVGEKGDIGLNGKDFDPIEVTRIDNRIDTNVISIDKLSSVNNRQDRTLQNHENRINDLDSRVGELEKTQYVAEVNFRVYDDKHLTISPFVRQNFTRNKMDMVGVRFTIKFGESYEEREIAKTNARLDNTEARLDNLEKNNAEPAYIEKTVVKDFWGKVKKTSWHIQPRTNGIAVESKF